MKIYHKFLLYQNKWIYPYVRVALRVMTTLTYLASILLIVGLVYEHGFRISTAEAHQLQRLYHGVWIVFLADISLHIALEYKDTRRTFSRLTWILTFLLYLTLVPVVFHRPEVEGAVQAVWDFLDGRMYHLSLLLVLSFLNLSYGLVRLLGRRTNPSLILAVSFLIIILVGTGLLMLPRSTVSGISWVDSLFISTSAVCDGADLGGCGVHLYDNGVRNHHPADSDWRFGGDDADELLRNVLHGQYFFVQSVGGARYGQLQLVELAALHAGLYPRLHVGDRGGGDARHLE